MTDSTGAFSIGDLPPGLYTVRAERDGWQTDLNPNPALNRDRVLAYSNCGLLARLGFVWACRGDLRIERVGKQELAALKARTAAN
jgi:hypothetical protein